MHVPRITKNLISVQQFCLDTHVFFEFHNSHFLMNDSRTGTPLLRGSSSNGLYSFPPQTLVGECTSTTQWHSRLGQPNLQLVHRIISKFSLPVTQRASTLVYLACCQAKSSQLPFNSILQHSTQPLQLIYLDVWGSAPIASRDGFQFYVAFLDDFICYTWWFPLFQKFDVLPVFT